MVLFHLRHLCGQDASAIHHQNRRLHDAQIDAIKTYLFLKLGCGNRPLWKLFNKGDFNILDLQTVSRSFEGRDFLHANPGLFALWEYAGQNNPKGKATAPALKKAIEQEPWDINSARIWKKIFYDVNYADYVFSLPPDANKTDLMAAFIYIDLYFAQQDLKDRRFAHNFMVLAPSGSYSSISPILEKNQNF